MLIGNITYPRGELFVLLSVFGMSDLRMYRSIPIAKGETLIYLAQAAGSAGKNHICVLSGDALSAGYVLLHKYQIIFGKKVNVSNITREVNLLNSLLENAKTHAAVTGKWPTEVELKALYEKSQQATLPSIRPVNLCQEIVSPSQFWSNSPYCEVEPQLSGSETLYECLDFSVSSDNNPLFKALMDALVIGKKESRSGTVPLKLKVEFRGASKGLSMYRIDFGAFDPETPVDLYSVLPIIEPTLMDYINLRTNYKDGRVSLTELLSYFLPPNVAYIEVFKKTVSYKRESYAVIAQLGTKQTNGIKDKLLDALSKAAKAVEVCNELSQPFSITVIEISSSDYELVNSLIPEGLRMFIKYRQPATGRDRLLVQLVKA